MSSRADVLHFETDADGRERGFWVPGCDTMLAVAREPIFAYTHSGALVCSDCGEQQIPGATFAIHHPTCWWLAAHHHVERCGCDRRSAVERARARGWRVMRGGRR